MLVSADSYDDCVDIVCRRIVNEDTVIHVRETSYTENNRILHQFPLRSLGVLEEKGFVNVLPFLESIFQSIEKVVKMDVRDVNVI